MAIDASQMPHGIILKDRKNLSVTGVTEVVSFDDTSVVLRTGMGNLVIQGQQLQLKNLTLEGGQVAVDGSISALFYEQQRQKGGWLGRLMG